MVERLFTYGSLMPGREYAHLLAEAGDDWQEASLTGFVDSDGWGHSVGYPALLVHEAGFKISGMVVTSGNLHKLWPLLDDFEGPAYQRTTTEVVLANGARVIAFVYELNTALQPRVRQQLGLT